MVERELRTRRQFCEACSGAGMALIGGAVLQACGGGSPTSGGGSNAPALPRLSAGVSGGAIQLTIDASSPLATPGSAAFVSSAARPSLLAAS